MILQVHPPPLVVGGVRHTHWWGHMTRGVLVLMGVEPRAGFDFERKRAPTARLELEQNGRGLALACESGFPQMEAGLGWPMAYDPPPLRTGRSGG